MAGLISITLTKRRNICDATHHQRPPGDIRPPSSWLWRSNSNIEMKIFAPSVLGNHQWAGRTIFYSINFPSNIERIPPGTLEAFFSVNCPELTSPDPATGASPFLVLAYWWIMWGGRVTQYISIFCVSLWGGEIVSLPCIWAPPPEAAWPEQHKEL